MIPLIQVNPDGYEKLINIKASAVGVLKRSWGNMEANGKTDDQNEANGQSETLISTKVYADDEESVVGENTEEHDSEETEEYIKYRLVSSRHYKTKFEEYDPEFMAFCEDNNITVPKLGSLKGQVIALVTHRNNRNKYVNRDILEAFLSHIEMKSGDCIQLVNKTEQWGLKSESTKHEGKQHYRVPYPFEYIALHVKKRSKLVISGSKEDKVDYIKDWIKTNYIDVPFEKWEIGHKDPNSEDNSEANLVYQPPIQGRFRDRFKFDEYGLIRYPTVKELKNNTHIYYNDDELRDLRDHLLGMSI
jgi:hypothetical protein